MRAPAYVCVCVRMCAGGSCACARMCAGGSCVCTRMRVGGSCVCVRIITSLSTFCGICAEMTDCVWLLDFGFWPTFQLAHKIYSNSEKNTYIKNRLI